MSPKPKPDVPNRVVNDHVLGAISMLKAVDENLGTVLEQLDFQQRRAIQDLQGEAREREDELRAVRAERDQLQRELARLHGYIEARNEEDLIRRGGMRSEHSEAIMRPAQPRPYGDSPMTASAVLGSRHR